MPHTRASRFAIVSTLFGLSLAGCPTDPVVTDAGSDAAVPPTDAPVTDSPSTTDTPTPPPDVPGADAGPPAAARTLPTNGSAIAINAAADRMVVANREADTIGVFSLDTSASPPTVTRIIDIATTAGAEPWQVVMGNGGDQAFVTLRGSDEVVRIDGLHTATPAIAFDRASTGSEPTGIAISPLGTAIYAANWVEGTVSQINATTMDVDRTIDLNDALVDTGALGTVTVRPGLAHPRAIVVTNDGDTDESDETIFVTEYFGVNRTDTVAADGFDVARQGIVYRFSFEGVVEGTTSLAPVANTTFVDSTGGATGCFPNQLLTASINRGFLHVAGVCASPDGPTGPVIDMATGLPSNTANFQTEVHTAIWTIDVGTHLEVGAAALLTAEFRDLYDSITPAIPANDPLRRNPLIPTDLAFVPASGIGYLTAYGSDAVFRVVYDTAGALVDVGFGGSGNNFINLSPTGMPAGQLPLGIAITPNTSNTAFVVNEATRNISFIGFAGQAVIGAAESTPMPAAGSAAEDVLHGRRFFVTGLGRWSFRGQAWNSCEACHGDGLTDNVTWYFGRGPRQSTSLDGSYGPTGERRVFNWTAIFDEMHDFELNTRGNSGGIGAVVHATPMPPSPADRIHFDGSTPVPAGTMATATNQAGLNGSVTSMMPGGATTPSSVLGDWDEIAAYARTIRAPHSPNGLVAADVTAGRALFEANGCAGCHGTNMWTTSRVFWTPSEATNAAAGTLRTVTYTRPGAYPAALNPPSSAGAAPLRFPAGATAAANDQIQCILASVGTFPATGMAPILPTGSSVILTEVRTNMTTLAQGLTGFNPPALVGMNTGAPYLHGGNARTLEEVFDATFEAHYQALSANFLDVGSRDDQIRQIVAFLLSIDDGTAAAADPAPGLGFDPTLCPDTL